MRLQKVNVDELTDEEKMQLAEAIQQVLYSEDNEKEQVVDKEINDGHHCNSCCSDYIVPTPEAMYTEPLQGRSFDNPDDNKHLVEIVRRIPVTNPIRDMQRMAIAMIDHAYRLGYKDGVVDTYYNFKCRCLKVPSITELENC